MTCPGGRLAGFGGLSGTALLGIFFTTTHTAGSAINSGTNPVANLVVPLGIIGGGSTVMTGGLGIYVKVEGAGWTTGTIKAINPTQPSFIHVSATNHVFPSLSFLPSTTLIGTEPTTFTLAGSRQTNTASGFNTATLTLVTPIQTFTTATGMFNAGFAQLTIHLVPEPATLVLVSAGIGSLVLYGRRRTKR